MSVLSNILFHLLPVSVYCTLYSVQCMHNVYFYIFPLSASLLAMQYTSQNNFFSFVFLSLKVVTNEKIGGSGVTSTLGTWYGGVVMGVLLSFNETAMLYRDFNSAPSQKQNIIVLVGFGRACAPVRCAHPSFWAHCNSKRGGPRPSQLRCFIFINLLFPETKASFRLELGPSGAYIFPLEHRGFEI
jgi:hypothetical protein